MKDNELLSLLRELIVPEGGPLVVSSAIWPFARLWRQDGATTVNILLEALFEAAEGKTVIMPAFVAGAVGGVCDLDRAPATTGVLAESFRCLPGTFRTASAFFPYAVRGPDSDVLRTLRPLDAWSDDSILGWMRERDCQMIMLGAHPTLCSFIHHAEWLARDVINYRYFKKFKNRVILDGEELDLEETLYVRSLAPEAQNDFTVLLPSLLEAGMKMRLLQGIPISHMSARSMCECAYGILRENPLFLISNPQDFE